jgi:LysM repeat protein
LVQKKVRRRSMSTSPTQLRLTTRGRLLLGASGLVVALSLFSATTALGSAAKAESSTTSTNPASAYYETITVLPGETLWSIAGQVDSKANKGDLVAAIIDLNGLSGSALQAGQRLRVPVASK